ncbi:hypothetical protein DIPPA_29836 [Diplonema papillatum]|nr:hypothetical protein DIPPA_29836 [Diplonema papillatum]
MDPRCRACWGSNVGLGTGLQGSSLPLSPSQLQMTSLAGMNASHLVHQQQQQQADSQKETQRLEALRKRHAAAAKSLRTEEAHHATLSNTLRLVERQVAAGRAEIEGIRAKVAEIAAVPTEAPSAEVVRLEAENDARFQRPQI